MDGVEGNDGSGVCDAEGEQVTLEDQIDAVRHEGRGLVGAISVAAWDLDGHLADYDVLAVEQDVDAINSYVGQVRQIVEELRGLVHAERNTAADRSGPSTMELLPLRRACPFPEEPPPLDPDEDVGPAQEWLEAIAWDFRRLAEDAGDGAEMGMSSVVSGTDADLATFVCWTEEVSRGLEEANRLWIRRLVTFGEISGWYPGRAGDDLQVSYRWMQDFLTGSPQEIK